MITWIQNVRHNCKEATQIALKKEEIKLNWKQNLQLRIHLFICKNCRRFLTQNKLMKKFTDNFLSSNESPLNSDQINNLKNISSDV